jgi:hypothetical protein
MSSQRKGLFSGRIYTGLSFHQSIKHNSTSVIITLHRNAYVGTDRSFELNQEPRQIQL